MPPQAHADEAEYKLPAFLERDGGFEDDRNYIDKLYNDIMNSYEQSGADHKNISGLAESAIADSSSQESAQDYAHSYEKITLTLSEIGNNIIAMRKYAKAVNASPTHRAEISELIPRQRTYESTTQEAA
jgi:hypothetical protein